MYMVDKGKYRYFKDTKYHLTGYMAPKSYFFKKRGPFNRHQECARRLRQLGKAIKT